MLYYPSIVIILDLLIKGKPAYGKLIQDPLSFRFAGPNKEKFEGMKEQRQGEVRAGIKSIEISEENKQTISTITTLITSALEVAKKFNSY